MCKAQQSSGASLVGLLVAMCIMVIVLGTANALFAFGVRTCQLNLNRLEVQENLRIGIDRVSREVRQAVEITSIDNNGSGRFSFKDPNGNLITYRIGISGDPEAAYQLIRAKNGYGNNPVARYVTRIYVEPQNTGTDVRIIHLTITGEKGDSGTMDVSTTITLRN
jgi:hypothetical protein